LHLFAETSKKGYGEEDNLRVRVIVERSSKQ
jgi:hypothetical protein